MVKENGARKTPAMVMELLKKAVAEKSQSAVARETGLTLLTVQQYLKGIGEPRQRNLERLANYFSIPMSVLRWNGDLSYEEISDILCDVGQDVPIGKAFQIIEFVIESLARRNVQLPDNDSPERTKYINIVKSYSHTACEEYRQLFDVQKNNLDKVIRSVRGNDLKDTIHRVRKLIVGDIRLKPQRSEEEAMEEITRIAGELVKRIITREYRDTASKFKAANKT